MIYCFRCYHIKNMMPISGLEFYIIRKHTISANDYTFSHI